MSVKPKVGILTTFTGADEAYSLVNVVRVQLEMMLEAGYHPVLFVADEFEPHENGIWSGKVVEIRKPAAHGAGPEQIKDGLKPLMGDIQVMICHDILFLGQNQWWAEAIRAIEPETSTAWLHWQHSRGDHSPKAAMGKSWYCYPNNGDLEHVARINSVDVKRVRYVPHPLDFQYLGWPRLAVRIAEDYNFPFVDVAMVYPSRLDRQKQIEKSVRIFAGLKRAGQKVCLLVADAYATGDHFKQYKRELNLLAEVEKLEPYEFEFLGDRYEECTFSTPRPTIKALLEMANLFIQTSNAETSSLVVMEAALAGNLVVINSDFKPIHHLYKRALTLPFGSVTEDVKYFRHEIVDGIEMKIEDPQQFWDDEAKNLIVSQLRSHTALGLKRQQLRDRWPSVVFAEYIEPLIQEAVAATRGMEIFEPMGDEQVTAIVTTLDNLSMLQKQIPVLLGEAAKIIVVNNGSRDGTRAWLNSLNNPRVQAIHRQNLGAGPGRNAGLDLWAGSTPYTLMLDGGIMPPIGGVQALKDYLLRHPECDVISPEVATGFTTQMDDATLFFPAQVNDGWTFVQRTLSGTAYCLCKARAWDGLRFSEDGPFGMPGWGVDDNDMAYRWNDAGITHHDIGAASGIRLYRLASGSFKRLYEETGIWPNQYGSVYEMRNVKAHQDWTQYHDPLWNLAHKPKLSFVIQDVPMPAFAKLVKMLHAKYSSTPHEIIALSVNDQAVKRWLDTFRWRWPWGDVTLDPDGNKLVRGKDYPEELWSGDVILDRPARGEEMKYIAGKEMAAFYLEGTHVAVAAAA